MTGIPPRQTLIFAGTPDFAAQALKALIEAGHRIALVLTQPDRPSGRGMKLQPSPVKVLALQHDLPVAQPSTLRAPEVQEMLRQRVADDRVEVMIVAAYGLILPQSVLDLPPSGCLNIHGSLLPRWRGAAPIQRAIEAGDSSTGVGIMKMEAGLDTGPVLLESTVPIGPQDSSGVLHDALAQTGARLIVEALARLPSLVPYPQATEGVTYAHKIEKAEGLLNFDQSATTLARRIRAFDPFPGCQATLLGNDSELPVPIKFWSAEPVVGQGAPGEIIALEAGGVVVACAEGALRVTELQKPGGKRLKARDFLAGMPIKLGQRFVSDFPGH